MYNGLAMAAHFNLKDSFSLSPSYTSLVMLSKYEWYYLLK